MPAHPVQTYLAALDTKLARMGDDGYRAAQINGELSAWERREQQLLKWTQSSFDGPCPYPMDAFQIAFIRNELDKLLEQIRAKARVKIVASQLMAAE